MIYNLTFFEAIRSYNDSLKPISLEIIQINVGLKCNKECTHCHLQAGPSRSEEMNLKTMKQIVELAGYFSPSLIDITGGAPEMNQNIKWLITGLKKGGHNIQVRTNLTALHIDDTLIDFLKENKVKLVASLPCYEESEVDSVRGLGTFNESIETLKILNKQGYGLKDDLELDLVFNPEADFLPPPQSKLEEIYHDRLSQDFGVEFTHLITITNMPIGRFKAKLEASKKYSDYMELLKNSYNPKTIESLMCRRQININWEGTMYDCDFNLALNIPIKAEVVNINNPKFEPDMLLKRDIVFGEHCFGCSAGQGSSCGGALTAC